MIDGFLKEIANMFDFTRKDACEMMRSFQIEMENGLKGRKSSLKMLPSFVRRPKGNEKGDFLAIDLGGTNMRILAIRLLGQGKIETIGMRRFSLGKEIISKTEDVFFDFIADCVSAFLNEHKLDVFLEVGFTFSFPVIQTSILSGVLVSWTKGFAVKGVEGHDVVTLLDKAFKRKGLENLKLVALANDTVGTLVTQSYINPLCDMGVILGTGTNAAYPERLESITKFKGMWYSEEMIINIEWGGFDKIKMTKYDEQLDKDSENPGGQRMEKMVSGRYLGEIARRIMKEAFEKGLLGSKELKDIFLKPYSLTTEQLSLIASDKNIFNDSGIEGISDKDIRLLKEIGQIVSKRAARIASAAIAAVLTHMDKELKLEHVIAIDGSLFEKYKGFKENMDTMMKEIFPNQADKIHLSLTHDGSGIGAAIIAASLSSH